jgi:hypothetical protein
MHVRRARTIVATCAVLVSVSALMRSCPRLEEIYCWKALPFGYQLESTAFRIPVSDTWAIDIVLYKRTVARVRACTAVWPVQLDFTVGGIKPISEGHSLISLYRGPIQIFVRREPIQIAENRAACGGCGSLAARAADTYRQKSLNYGGEKKRKKKKHHLDRVADFRVSARITHSSTHASVLTA